MILALAEDTGDAGGFFALLALVAIVAYLVALAVSVANMVDPGTSTPARWSYAAATWTLVLAPVVVLKAGGWW